MSRRLLTLCALVVGLVLASATGVSASDNWSGTSTTKSASAHAGSGAVTVGAGIYRHRPPARPTTTTVPTTTTTDPPAVDPPTSDPPPVVTCELVPINLVEFQNLLGIGGPTPGYWGMDQCTGPSGTYAKGPPVWIYDGPPANGSPDPTAPTPPAAAPPAPVTVAQQAASTLNLPSPVIEMAPPQPSEQLISVNTWLWIAPAAWQPETVTATVDGVSATATATPTEVVWNMGDGHSVTCDGPGTPYEASDPNATTDCSYTWTTPSSSQPSGTYHVTATIEFSVTWTAVGVAGGGNLGLVPGAANAAQVTVGESQALNTGGSA